MRADHDEPEQLAVARLVDRLDPADRLVLHHGARVRDPRELADRDVVAVLLARLRLGEADAGDLRVGVDRPRDGAVVDDRVVAASRSRPRPRPRGTRCARAASSRRSRRPRRCAGRSCGGARRRRCPCACRTPRRSSSSPSPSTSGPRPTATSIRSASTVSPSPKWTVSFEPSSSTFVHCLPSWSAIPRLPNCFASSFARVGVLLRDQRVEHLDDRHLGAEAVEDRRELAADDPAAEDDEPPRHLLVCASRPVESTQRGESSPSIGGRSGNEPVATIADLNVTSSPPSTAIVFASLKRPVPFTHSTPFALKRLATPHVICLTTPAFHSFAAAKSSFGSPTLTPNFAKLSSASLQRERGLHPRLRRDAADAQARAAELRLLLDAGDLRAELRGADRGGVAARGRLRGRRRQLPCGFSLILEIIESMVVTRSVRAARASSRLRRLLDDLAKPYVS